MPSWKIKRPVFTGKKSRATMFKCLSQQNMSNHTRLTYDNGSVCVIINTSKSNDVQWSKSWNLRTEQSISLEVV